MAKAQNVDAERLDKAIEKSGLRIGFICDTLGISRQAFDKKRKSETAFRPAEIYVLRDLLKLDESQVNEIFLPGMLGESQTGAS